MKYIDDDTLMSPPLEALIDRIPQKYELVLAATKRAKQIIREHRLNGGAFSEEERRKKPLSMALRDIADGRVGQDLLEAPDIEFDEIGETDELQSEIERMGVLPFTTRPLPEFITESPAAGGTAVDFSIDEDEEDEDEDEELDADADYDDETVEPL